MPTFDTKSGPRTARAVTETCEALVASASTKNSAGSRPRCTNHQPLEVARIPGAQLTVKTACAVSGFSSSTLYRRWADVNDDFPKPVRFGARCTRVNADALMAWMAAQHKPTATEANAVTVKP